MGNCTSNKNTDTVDNAPKPLTAAELAKIEAEKQRLERLGESPEPLEDFVPHPAFVIKTKRINTHQKAFINVFHHELVPTSTRFITRDEQWKVDKKEESVCVFTVVLPSSAYQALLKDPMSQPTVCTKIIGLLNDMYTMAKLDMDYVLPKIKQGFIGEDIDLVSSDPSAVEAYAAKRHSDRVAGMVSATPNPVASQTPANVLITSPHLALQKLCAAEQARKLHIPPKMQGWLKKKGHIVVNWKTRYFVLDCGYLTYFVDQQIDGAPYGQDRKGQLCLAGYRVVHSGSTGAGSNNPHDVPELGDAAAPEFQYRAQLMLMDSALHEAATGRAAEYEVLVLEAANLEEKQAWLAAITAHTQYVEGSVQAGQAVQQQLQTQQQKSDSNITVVVPITGHNDPRPWHIYLSPATHETIILTGLVNKPNPVGKTMLRQLILTSQKRLLYVDHKTLELKGSIEWPLPGAASTVVEPFVKILNASSFEIHAADKTYKFLPQDGLTAQHWLEALQSIKLQQ